MNLSPLTDAPPHRDLFYPPHCLPESLVLPPNEREVEPLEMPPRQELELVTPEPPQAPAYAPAEATVKTIQRYFTAYEFQDLEAMEHLLTRDFSFSSPLNHRIDRATYFREYWSIHPQHTVRIERIFEKDTEAFVTYECQRTDGTQVQKTGFFILRGDQIRHLHIYCDSALDMMPGA